MAADKLHALEGQHVDVDPFGINGVAAHAVTGAGDADARVIAAGAAQQVL